MADAPKMDQVPEALKIKFIRGLRPQPLNLDILDIFKPEKLIRFLKKRSKYYSKQKLKKSF
jgi:hypothetical protein